MSFPQAGEPRSTGAEGAEPKKTNEQDWSAVRQGARLKGLGRGFEAVAVMKMKMKVNVLMTTIMII